MKIHRLIQDAGNEYTRLLHNGRTRGVDVGLPKFDAKFSFKRKSTLYIYGPPYSGKSTFWHFLAVRLAYRHGWKFALYSPETGEPEDIYADLTEFYLGKRFILDGRFGMTQKEVDNAMGFIHSHFVVLTDLKTPDDFLQAADNTADHFEGLPDCASCDPWNEFYHDMRDHGGRDLYMEYILGRFREDARLKNRLNTIITHPQNEDDRIQDNNGVKIHYQPVTRPNRIAGGQAWARKGLNMMSVWRPPPPDIDGNVLLRSTGEPYPDGFVSVSIDKVKPRELGEVGKVELIYDFPRRVFV